MLNEVSIAIAIMILVFISFAYFFLSSQPLLKQLGNQKETSIKNQTPKTSNISLPNKTQTSNVSNIREGRIKILIK